MRLLFYNLTLPFGSQEAIKNTIQLLITHYASLPMCSACTCNYATVATHATTNSSRRRVACADAQNKLRDACAYTQNKMTQPTKTRLPQNKGIGPATEKRYESALQNERFHNIYEFVNAKESNFLKIVMVHAMLAGLKHVSAVKARRFPSKHSTIACHNDSLTLLL